jgi:signal transduction histidine kinase
MLYDAFSNIIWDCIKNASGDDAIDISLYREIKDHQSKCIVLIDNHGMGLTDEQKIRLFEQPRKGMKRTGGRGIGLYLAKKIIDRFGGTILIEDLEHGNYKKGTRFIIMLPACR